MDDPRIWSATGVCFIAIVVTHVISLGKCGWAFNCPHAAKRLIGSVAWWEYFLLIIPPLLICPLMAYVGSKSAASDVEQWGSFVVKAEYYEDWDEYIHQICTRTVSCGKDCTTVEIYDCSYVDYHPAYWVVTDNIGQEIRITEQRYHDLVARFGNETFTDLHRHYYLNDGDKYETVFKYSDPIASPKLTPLVTNHSYENRVAVAHSVFSYMEVDAQDVERNHLFDYHKASDEFDDQCVLSHSPQIASNDLFWSNHTLSRWNSYLGTIRQVRMIVLLFPDDTSRQTGLLQEALWKGGNKNEVVVCIGVNKDQFPFWCHVFSWSESDAMKIEIRTKIDNEMVDQTLSGQKMISMIDFIAHQCRDNFVRRQFHEFDYLSVPCSWWAVIVCWILNIGCTVGISVFVMNNEFDA